MNKHLPVFAIALIVTQAASAQTRKQIPLPAMMPVYIGADPAKDGKPDFWGMMAGYSQFFGTKDQPNKPAGTTLKVVLPAADRGALIKTELIVVNPKG